MDYLNNIITNLINNIVAFFDLGSVVNRILDWDFGFFGKDGLNNLTDIAATNGQYINAASGSGEYIHGVGKLMSSLEPIGLAICGLFFLLGLIDLGMSDRLTFESFMKDFGKLAAGVFFVCNAETFVNLGLGMGKWVSALLNEGDKTLDLTAVSTSLSKGFDTSGGIASLIGTIVGGVLALAVMLIIGLFMIIAAMFICFTRVFELALRAIFMPIALALMCDDGWRGAAGRYIKKFIALCVQAAAIRLIANLYNFGVQWLIKADKTPFASDGSLFGTVGNEITGTGGALLVFVPVAALGIAAIAMMFKSQGIVNDVFGA